MGVPWCASSRSPLFTALPLSLCRSTQQDIVFAELLERVKVVPAQRRERAYKQRQERQLRILRKSQKIVDNVGFENKTCESAFRTLPNMCRQSERIVCDSPPYHIHSAKTNPGRQHKVCRIQYCHLTASIVRTTQNMSLVDETERLIYGARLPSSLLLCLR